MPDATVFIPTYDRPRQLRDAVDSALAQTVTDTEVLVVDDASPEPVVLPSHPRLRVLRLVSNSGHTVARNAGLEAARGRWVTCLDDDDLLLPRHLELALTAIEATDLPPPVASLSGVEVALPDGRVVETRLPPDRLPKGSLYSLEEEPPGRSFGVRATLVVERSVLLGIGGWDPTYRSRDHTEMFLRLNPVCSLVGVPVPTYRRNRHDGPQVSGDPTARLESQRRLEARHAELLAARPARHADMVFRQSVKLWQADERRAALQTWRRAVRIAPARTGRRTAEELRERLAAAAGRR